MELSRLSALPFRSVYHTLSPAPQEDRVGHTAPVRLSLRYQVYVLDEQNKHRIIE